MKKLFLTACVAVLGAFSLNAQGLAFRAEVGGNVATKTVSSDIASLEFKNVMGLRLGAAAEYALSPNMYLSGGLNYVMGGAKVKNPITKNIDTTRDHSLTVPVNFGGRFAVSDAFAVSVEAGPYASFLLAAKTTAEGVGKDVKDDYKSFEAGLGISVAGEFQNRYYLRLGSDFGLTNIAKNTVGDEKYKSNQFYLSLGIRF